MKTLAPWTEEELRNELKRYKDRQAFLHKDFAERNQDLAECIQKLEAELARRKSGATDTDQHHRT